MPAQVELLAEHHRRPTDAAPTAQRKKPAPPKRDTGLSIRVQPFYFAGKNRYETANDSTFGLIGGSASTLFRITKRQLKYFTSFASNESFWPLNVFVHDVSIIWFGFAV